MSELKSHRTEPGKELLYSLFILHFTSGCIEKLLVQLTFLLNVHGPPLLAVPAVHIQHIGHSVAQVLGTINPKQLISIKHERGWCESETFSCKYGAFSEGLGVC